MERELRKKIEYFFKDYFNKKDASVFSEASFAWQNVINETFLWLGKGDKSDLLKSKYSQKLNETQLCIKYFITKTTLYSWLNYIFDIALILAISKNLVKIDVNERKLYYV